jgi:Tol biopolymer transport system component
MTQVSRAYTSLLILTVAACSGEGINGPTTGSMEITSVTRGEPVDPDGYTIAIDARRESLPANATITVADIALGQHQLELLGVAPNCVLSGDNPRSVTLSPEVTLRLTLEISCGAGQGAINVYTRTIGPDPDPDGYAVQLDAGATQPINLNSLATFPAVPVGDHSLLLSGVADNCAVTGANPRSLTVEAGKDTGVTFALTCRSTASGTLLITSDRSGEPHVYRVEPDGSRLEDLTPDADGTLPDWSPDRTRIAFGSTRDGDEGVYVMDADGSLPKRLATGGAPAWSPDGSRIAFSGPNGVTVMNADGSGQVLLSPGYSPTWSPEGTRIAFNRGRCVADICQVGLYLMNADGSAVHTLTPDEEFGIERWSSPSWSPDGMLIAFTRRDCSFFECRFGIATVEPSGGAPSTVYQGNAAGRPVWSPDGATLAFALSQQDGTTELMLIPSRGGVPDVLATSRESEYPGSWR